MIKIFLENKQLLKEVSYEDAFATIESKKFTTALYNKILPIDLQREQVYMDILHFIKMIKIQIKECIPEDINDNQKALSILWLKNLSLRNPLDFVRRSNDTFKYWLEQYFKLNGNPSFVSEKDLNKIEHINTLRKIAMEGFKKQQEWMAKKEFLDADKGTEKIAETEEWNVFIPQNKGAACKLGKGTSWCTAAPGLDYYERYHKPKDPLIIFISKTNPSEKYQFHYSSSQLKDKNDEEVISKKIINSIMNVLFSLEKDPIKTAKLQSFQEDHLEAAKFKSKKKMAEDYAMVSNYHSKPKEGEDIHVKNSVGVARDYDFTVDLQILYEIDFIQNKNIESINEEDDFIDELFKVLETRINSLLATYKKKNFWWEKYYLEIGIYPFRSYRPAHASITCTLINQSLENDGENPKELEAIMREAQDISELKTELSKQIYDMIKKSIQDVNENKYD